MYRWPLTGAGTLLLAITLLLCLLVCLGLLTICCNGGKPTVMSKENEAHKAIHLQLPTNVHKRLKVMCALKETTIREYATTALLSKMEEDDKAIRPVK